MTTRKKKLTAFPRLNIPGDICKTYDLFTLFPHLLPISVLWKKLASRPRMRWLFWDISLPSSQSASFPNKVIIPCLNTSSPDSLACRVASRVSLDSVTKTLTLFSVLNTDYEFTFIQDQCGSGVGGEFTTQWSLIGQSQGLGSPEIKFYPKSIYNGSSRSANISYDS